MCKLSEADTADAVVAQVSVGTAADLAAVVLAGGELRRRLLLEDHRFLSHCVAPPLCFGDERGAHELEQLACFLIGLGGGDDGDVHAAELLDLIVLDLGEDQLLLDCLLYTSDAADEL